MLHPIVIEVLSAMLGVNEDSILPTDRVADLAGYDSVQALRLISHLEESLGLRLDFERFYQAETVQDLMELVNASA